MPDKPDATTTSTSTTTTTPSSGRPTTPSSSGSTTPSSSGPTTPSSSGSTTPSSSGSTTPSTSPGPKPEPGGTSPPPASGEGAATAPGTTPSNPPRASGEGEGTAADSTTTPAPTPGSGEGEGEGERRDVGNATRLLTEEDLAGETRDRFLTGVLEDPAQVNNMRFYFRWVRRWFPNVTRACIRDLNRGLQLARGQSSELDSNWKPMLQSIKQGMDKLVEGFGCNQGTAADWTVVLDGLGTLLAGVYDKLQEAAVDENDAPVHDERGMRVNEKEAFHQSLARTIRAIVTSPARLAVFLWNGSGEEPPAPEEQPGDSARLPMMNQVAEGFIEFTIGGLKLFSGCRKLNQNLTTGWGDLFGAFGRIVKGIIILVRAGTTRNVQRAPHSPEHQEPGDHPNATAVWWATVIGNVGGWIDQLIKTINAFMVWIPLDLRGDWNINGADDNLSWKMEIDDPELSAQTTRRDGSLVYQGKLYAIGEVNGRFYKEQRATVEFFSAEGLNYSLNWTGTGATGQLSSPFDAQFARGQLGSLSLQGSSFAMTARQVGWLTTNNRRHNLFFGRGFALTKGFDFMAALGKLLWKSVTLTPEWKREAENRLQDLSESLTDILPAWFREHVEIGIHNGAGRPDLTAGRWYAHLGFDFAEKVTLAADWDIGLLFDFDPSDLQGREASPIVPASCSVTLRHPRVGGGIRLGWSRWDQTREGDGGSKGGLEDSIPFLKDLVNEYVGGENWNLLEPVLKGNLKADPPEIPRVELPVVIFVNEVGGDANASPPEPAYPLRSKFSLTFILEGEAILSYFPAMRACMMAWDVGYAAGTLLRELLLQSETYQAMEDGFQNWWADLMYDTDITNQVTEFYGNSLVKWVNSGYINHHERYLLDQKSAHYIWSHVHARPACADVHDGFRRGVLEEIEEDLEKIERNDLNGVTVNSAAEAHLYKYLWGSSQQTKPSLQTELRRSMEAGTISRPRYLIYLEWLKELNEPVDRAGIMDAITAARNQLSNDSAGAEVDQKRRLELVTLHSLVDSAWDPRSMTNHLWLQGGSTSNPPRPFEVMCRMMRFGWIDMNRSREFYVSPDSDGQYRIHLYWDQAVANLRISFWDRDAGTRDDRITISQNHTTYNAYSIQLTNYTWTSTTTTMRELRNGLLAQRESGDRVQLKICVEDLDRGDEEWYPDYHYECLLDPTTGNLASADRRLDSEGLSQTQRNLNGPFDAALKTSGNRVYFFKGSRCALVDIVTRRMVAGYPKAISQEFPGLWSSDIDAAIDWDDRAYFFKGHQYSRMERTNGRWQVSTVRSYPRNITSFHSTWPDAFDRDLSAAVNWNNGYAYFFKGSQYIKWNTRSDERVGGLRSINSTNWPQLEAPLDAAFHCEAGHVEQGGTPCVAYFFKGEQVQRYIDVGGERAMHQVDIAGQWGQEPVD